MQKLVLGVILMLTIGTTHAEGPYAGVKYMMISSDIEALGISGGTAEPIGLAFILGNEIYPQLAVEGTFLANGSDDEFDGLAAGLKVEMDSLIDIAIVAKSQLSPQMGIYGKAGLALIKFKDSDGDTADSTGLSLGAGLNISAGSNANLFVEYLILPDADYDDFPGLSITSVSSLNIGASVKF